MKHQGIFEAARPIARRTKKITVSIITGAAICAFIARAGLAGEAHTGEYRQISCVLHIQSTVSDGNLTIDEIIRAANEKGVDVVCVTDHDCKRWSYGVPPFRNIIKKTVEQGSILSFGPERYLSLLREAQKKYPEVVVIPGAECAAFYYWDGFPFEKNFKMRAWHRHILAIGLESSKAYDDLPLVSNGKSRYDQYSGDRWHKPQQDLIDYINEQGGLAYWAHPEAENSVKVGGVLIHTLPYPELLGDTSGYAGFSIFHEGYKTIGNPGGSWDELLNEYCRGDRADPVWAVGEVDYEGRNTELIDNVKNILLVAGKGKKEALEALKKGRSYVVVPGSAIEPVLDEFRAYDENMTKSATIGEELAGSSKITVKIALSSKRKTDALAAIMLIKNGEIYKMYEEKLPCEIALEESPDAARQGLTYYRIDVTCQNAKLVSNPIFWRPNKTVTSNQLSVTRGPQGG